MNEKPLVTICFLAYNCAGFLEKALQPLINQTYQNTQIIVSNNQSTDNTAEVIKRLQAKYPQLIARENIPNVKTEEFSDIGIGDASGIKKRKSYDVCLNHCNSILTSGLVKGELVIFCHQDDIYQTDIVEKEVEFLLAHPEVPAVFSMGNIINEHDAIIGEYKLPKPLPGKNVHHFNEIFKAILNHGNTFLITPTLMAHRSLFDSVGLFDDQGPFGGSDDLEMWLRILEKYPIGILPEKLINWRTDGRGKKSNQLRTQEADFFKVMDYYLVEKKYASVANKKDLRQYAYQKDFDNTLRAMNFLLMQNANEAKTIINNSFSPDNFRAFFENPKVLRAKVLGLKILLFIGINLGLKKPLEKLLRRIS